MKTYVLSEYGSRWSIYCLEDGVEELASGVSGEEKAMRLVLDAAMKNKPSQVLKIEPNGANKVIARFEESK